MAHVLRPLVSRPRHKPPYLVFSVLNYGQLSTNLLRKFREYVLLCWCIILNALLAPAMASKRALSTVYTPSGETPKSKKPASARQPKSSGRKCALIQESLRVNNGMAAHKLTVLSHFCCKVLCSSKSCHEFCRSSLISISCPVRQ